MWKRVCGCLLAQTLNIALCEELAECPTLWAITYVTRQQFSVIYKVQLGRLRISADSSALLVRDGGQDADVNIRAKGS